MPATTSPPSAKRNRIPPDSSDRPTSRRFSRIQPGGTAAARTLCRVARCRVRNAEPISCRYQCPIGWDHRSPPSRQQRNSRASGIWASWVRSTPRCASRRVALPPIAIPAPISRSSASCSKTCTDIDCRARLAARVRPPIPAPTMATSHMRIMPHGTSRSADIMAGAGYRRPTAGLPLPVRGHLSGTGHGADPGIGVRTVVPRPRLPMRAGSAGDVRRAHGHRREPLGAGGEHRVVHAEPRGLGPGAPAVRPVRADGDQPAGLGAAAT